MEEKVITDTKMEGDLHFDGKLIFLNSVEITGNLRARSVYAYQSINVRLSYITTENDWVGGYQDVGGYQEVGESQKVGEYINYSMVILDLDKIKTRIIRFTPTYYHERRFWIAQLKQTSISTKLLDPLMKAIKTECWNEIFKAAEPIKCQLLASPHLMPAVRQAIKLMIK